MTALLDALDALLDALAAVVNAILGMAACTILLTLWALWIAALCVLVTGCVSLLLP
jgi:hypothetical protein